MASLLGAILDCVATLLVAWLSVRISRTNQWRADLMQTLQEFRVSLDKTNQTLAVMQERLDNHINHGWHTRPWGQAEPRGRG